MQTWRTERNVRTANAQSALSLTRCKPGELKEMCGPYERCSRFVTALTVRTDRKSKMRTESVRVYWTCVDEKWGESKKSIFALAPFFARAKGRLVASLNGNVQRREFVEFDGRKSSKCSRYRGILLTSSVMLVLTSVLTICYCPHIVFVALFSASECASSAKNARFFLVMNIHLLEEKITLREF